MAGTERAKPEIVVVPAGARVSKEAGVLLDTIGKTEILSESGCVPEYATVKEAMTAMIGRLRELCTKVEDGGQRIRVRRFDRTAFKEGWGGEGAARGDATATVVKREEVVG